MGGRQGYDLRTAKLPHHTFCIECPDADIWIVSLLSGTLLLAA